MAITTNWTARTKPQGDLGYLNTQLGFLNETTGNRILFHTGTFETQDTFWRSRTYPNL